jgi:hypothetical protein
MGITFSTIIKAVGDVGLPVVLAILMWLFFSKQNKFFQTTITSQNTFLQQSFENIAIVLKDISKHIGKSLLSQEETLSVFKDVEKISIHEIIEYCAEVLENNNLIDRREQISKNLKTKLQEIFQKQASKLSMFNTPAGDLGIIYSHNFNAVETLKHLIPIFFSNVAKRTKLNDIKQLLSHYSIEALKEIEDKIHNN